MDNSLFKTRERIAQELGISRRTLDRKLKEAGIILSIGLVSPKDQMRIYTYFGYFPFGMSQNDATV